MTRTARVVICSAFVAATLHAQTPQTFAAASIRPNVTGNQQGGGLAAPQPGGRFVAIGATLRRLVADAYDGVMVVGGPAWIDRDRFDVNARAGGERSPVEIRRMLRPLLADRFKLVVHRETRELPIYTLTLVQQNQKLGPKLRPSEAKCAEDARNYFPGGASGGGPACGDFRLGARTLAARGMTMAGLAGVLGGRVDRPIIDRTGLDSAYDLDIEWLSDLGLRQAPPGTAGAADLAADGVTLFTALQEQLGLRLDAGRGPVDVLVIDRAEPPTPD